MAESRTLRDDWQHNASSKTQQNVWMFLLAIAHVVAFVLAFPPFNLWPLVVLAPAALAVIALRAPSTRSAVITAFAAQLALWLVLGFWLVQITELGYPFYAPYLALYGALFAWIIRRLHASSRSWLASSLPLTLTLPIAWTGLEFLRGAILFSGYPWFMLAHPLIEVPLIAQSADIFGMYFVSFLAATVSGVIVDCFRVRWGRMPRRALATTAVCVAIIWLGNIAYGAWRMQQRAGEPGPTLLVIQTNLPQDNKMRATAEQRREQLESFVNLTVNAVMDAQNDGRDIDLVVWPETMVFGFGFEPETIQFLVENDWFPGDWPLRNLQALIDHFDVPMLVGSQASIGLRVEDDTYDADAIYNSAYLLGTDGSQQRYDKIHLTPFGETMPYISNWPWLEEQLLTVAARGMAFDLDPGESTEPLALDWNGSRIELAAPICFEITMPRICRSLVNGDGAKRADVLINLSNDGWFGWYDAGRTQHAQIARYRAIENRVPVVRAANTGLSVHADSAGRLVAGIGPGRYGEPRQAGWLVAELTLDSRETVFARIGDLWAWIALAGTTGLVILPWIGRRSASHHGESARTEDRQRS